MKNRRITRFLNDKLKILLEKRQRNLIELELVRSRWKIRTDQRLGMAPDCYIDLIV